MARDDEFADFVAARYRALVRTGLLLTGDAGHLEDLAQSALIRTYRAWPRLREPASAESYARKVLTLAGLPAGQRRWRGEIAAGRLPEPPVSQPAEAAAAALRASGYDGPARDAAQMWAIG